ncbi:MAG: hypothetical protein P8181_04270 [bacterium]
MKSRPVVTLAAAAAFGLLGVLILAGCGVDPAAPNNVPPALVSLVATPEAAAVGAVCTIKARATDPNGDELTYEWAAAPGYVTGGGREVSLTVESCCVGGNVVLVTVRDGRGGETRGTVVVGVRR